MGLRKYEPKKVEEVQEIKEDVIQKTEKVTKVEEEVQEAPLIKTEGDIELENKVNEKRKEYSVYAKKQKNINIVITTFIAAVLIASFILMMLFSKQHEWVLYVSLGAMIAVLALSYLSSKIMKKNLMEKVNVYVDFLSQNINAYIFEGKDIKNLTSTPRGQLDDKWFLDAHFYKDIVGTKGRNFVHFDYKGVEVDSCDLAGNTKIKGRLSPKFLGRFYSFKPNYKTDGKVSIFQLKGGSLSVPLDDIDDLKLIEGNDKYVIYSNDPEVKKVLNQKVISALLKFKVQNPLIDVIFSVKDNLVSLGIDYVDEFINIPVENEFTIKNTKISKENLKKVLKVIDALLETKKTTTEVKENNK